MGKPCTRQDHTTENFIATFKRVVSRKVQVKIGEETRMVTLAEAVLLKNFNNALQRSDQSAMDNIMRLAERCGELVDHTDPARVGYPISIGEHLTVDEYIEKHGIERQSDIEKGNV